MWNERFLTILLTWGALYIIGRTYPNKMTLNPAYEAIGKGFVQQYYALFDDPAQRQNLANMYNVSFPLNKSVLYT